MPARRTMVPVCLGLALALACPATARSIVVPGGSGKAELATRDLLADSLWDDGRAEITTYSGTIERYGVTRPLSAQVIVVKEDMDSTQGVKSAAGPVAGHTREVLKQNLIRNFRTGSYEYHQMCSTFLGRATGRLEKLAMSSVEGCGVTFVELRRTGAGFIRDSHSYWADEGDRIDSIATYDGRLLLADDMLPLWLRRLDLGRPQSFEVLLYPGQVSNRVSRSRVDSRSIEVVGQPDRYGLPVVVGPTDLVVGITDDPEGNRQSERVDRYWFDPVWPHPLVRFEGGTDPTVLTRVKTTRLAYWEKTAPGDERLLMP